MSHKKATNLPMFLDLPDRIHALVANKSKGFIILDNKGNPFVSSNNLFGDSSVDTDSVEVKAVGDDDNSSSDSEDSSSNNESGNSGVSDRRPSKEGVNETDRQVSEEQQGHFNMRGLRGNLPPPLASHRSGLCQPRQVNYTHTTLNHTKNNSKTQPTPNSHVNKNSKRRLTPKPKYEYLDDVDAVFNNSKNRTTPSKKKTRKHKSHDQENP